MNLSTEQASSSPFEDVNILQQIVSFVGQYQYRFVAGINKDFKDAYLQLFSDKHETYYNASTVKHAMIS
jgi:hypothetical protein